MMNNIQKRLVAWAKENAQTIIHHLKTSVNPDVDWDLSNMIEIVLDTVGDISAPPEPYFEELQHVLNDGSEDLGIPIPPEFIAYRLGLWANNKIPVSHSLVQNAAHWRQVAIASEFDDASEEDMTQFIRLLQQVARGEAAENLPSEGELEEHFGALEGGGQLFTVATQNGTVFIASVDDFIVAMNEEGELRALDYNGNQVHHGENLSRYKEYITQGMKFSRPIESENALASLVGNATADLLLGKDSISVFDLPE